MKRNRSHTSVDTGEERAGLISRARQELDCLKRRKTEATSKSCRLKIQITKLQNELTDVEEEEWKIVGPIKNVEKKVDQVIQLQLLLTQLERQPDVWICFCEANEVETSLRPELEKLERKGILQIEEFEDDPLTIPASKYREFRGEDGDGDWNVDWENAVVSLPGGCNGTLSISPISLHWKDKRLLWPPTPTVDFTRLWPLFAEAVKKNGTECCGKEIDDDVDDDDCDNDGIRFKSKIDVPLTYVKWNTKLPLDKCASSDDDST